MAKKYIDAEKLIKKIKQKQQEYLNNTNGVATGSSVHLNTNDLLKIIDSLQQEQPCDTCTNDKGCVTCKDGELWEGKEQPSDDLNDEVKKFIEEYGYERGEDKLLIAIVARHFAEWGAEHLKK